MDNGESLNFSSTHFRNALRGYSTKEKKTLESRLDTTHAFLLRIDDTQFYASACLAACALRKLVSSLRRVNGASNLVGAMTVLRFVQVHASLHSSNFVSVNSFPFQCYNLCFINFLLFVANSH